jgi:hypothetical protein
VFASFLRFDWIPSLVDHVPGMLLGLWLAATIFGQAQRRRAPASGPTRPLLGALEGSVVLGGVILVYALFALARLLVALRGDEYVLRTTGLTYAEYARSGFFQLLAAAALTVVVLIALRSVIDLPTTVSRRVFAILAAMAVVLTLVMVHSATVRLGLYDRAFGLTMLRLYSTIFAWWVGGVLVLVGASLCGLGSSRSWLPGAIATSALAVLLAVNVANPEKVVIRRNVAHAQETGRFDLDHASGLSADAVPALVDALDELPPEARASAPWLLCARDRRPADDSSWNLAEQAAAAARARICA